jgi:hypothetical protein
MPTWNNNFSGRGVHADNAFGDFENFQRSDVHIWNNFDRCSFQLVKCLDTGPRDKNEIIGTNFVEEPLGADVFRELTVEVVVVDIGVNFALGVGETEEFDSQFIFFFHAL